MTDLGAFPRWCLRIGSAEDAPKPPFSRRRWVAQAAGRPPFGGGLASSSLARSNGAATARAFSLKNLCAILLYQLGPLVELIHALHSEA